MSLRLLVAAAALVLPLLSMAAPVRYRVEVVREYPHDRSSYTQGLSFHEGRMLESTGLRGSSTLREVDLRTGDAVIRSNFPKEVFAEGSVVYRDALYVLTWQNRQAYVYDPVTLRRRAVLPYPREGWGLTTDGESLIASDGSSELFWLDSGLRTIRTLTVTLRGKPLQLLNELEWIDGRIWANVYTTDYIVVINPRDGVVEGVIDCRGLLPEHLRGRDTDVLNGIATDAQGRIYLTGKNWPRLYEVRLVEVR